MKGATVEQLAAQVERLQRQLGRVRRGEREESMALSRGDVVGPGGAVGQIWTPGWLARTFIRWCGVRHGMRVLDCGSGMGALAHAAADVGARVTAVERDPRLVERTRARLEARGVTVIERDLLVSDRRQTSIAGGAGYDLAISNPPWEGDLPALFAAAMLERAPRAGLIVPQAVLSGAERSETLWGIATPVAFEFLRTRPAFDGMGGGGGKRDVMLLELRRGGCRGRDVMVRVGVGK